MEQNLILADSAFAIYEGKYFLYLKKDDLKIFWLEVMFTKCQQENRIGVAVF